MIDKKHDIREVFKMADQKTEMQNELKRKGQLSAPSMEHDIIENRKKLQQTQQ